MSYVLTNLLVKYSVVQLVIISSGGCSPVICYIMNSQHVTIGSNSLVVYNVKTTCPTLHR